VWTLGEFAAAAAMWIPPGAEPDGETIIAVLTGRAAPEKHDKTFAVLEQMDEAHPRYPHWYLPWLGVDTGVGGLVLAASC
jgi:hypothetical protein